LIVTTSHASTSDPASSWKRRPSSLSTSGQAVAVGVVKADVERGEPPQDRRADAPGGYAPHLHALEVVGAGGAVGDVPAPIEHPLVGGDVVAHEREDHHHDVLGHADAVRVGHLGDRQAVLDRGLQVDVIGADAGGQRELQLRRLRDPLGREVGRPERL